ncbi:hypothetical protein GF322_03870 [Candidatus Dependentiae bacterium]|nr:hypothetical protein [Candidatus Dependentiae bacterium]
MVGKSLWKNLKRLVDVDLKIKKLDTEIIKTEKIVTRDQDKIPKFNQEKIFLEEQLLQKKKKVNEQEITAKDLREKESHKKEILDSVSNQKEYKAIEKELKNLTHQRMHADDMLVQAWHELEEFEKKLKKQKDNIKNKIIQLQEGMQIQESNLKDLFEQKNELVKKRHEAVKDIPIEWLTKYDRMKDKVSDPIVSIINSSCSACYYPVLTKDLYKLKKSGVLPCRNCYRFLYYDEQEEKDNNKNNY